MHTSGVTHNLLGLIKQETEKAIKFEVDMEGSLLHGLITWWPLSQIFYIRRSHSMEDMDEITVSDWIYGKKAEDFVNMESRGERE